MSAESYEKLLATTEREGTEARDEHENTVLGHVLLNFGYGEHVKELEFLGTVQKLLDMGADVEAYVYLLTTDDHPPWPDCYLAWPLFSYVAQDLNLYFLRLFRMFLATGVPAGAYTCDTTKLVKPRGLPTEFGADNRSNFKYMLPGMLIDGPYCLDVLDIKPIHFVNIFLEAGYQPDNDDLCFVVSNCCRERRFRRCRFNAVEDVFMIDLMISARL